MRNLKNLFGITLLGLVSCAYNDESLTPEDSYPQALRCPAELCFVVADTSRVVDNESKALDIANRFCAHSGLKTRATSEGIVTPVYQENGAGNGFFNYNDWEVVLGDATRNYSKDRKAIVGFK